jgi:hypothetical protein
MRRLAGNEEWLDYDGMSAFIDGRKYRLEVKSCFSRFRGYAVFSVYAKPVNKDAAFYREIREELGDDWATDVLASDVELEADILRQCRAQDDRHSEEESPDTDAQDALPMTA